MKISTIVKRGIAFLIDIFFINLLSQLIDSRFQITKMYFKDNNILTIFHCNFGVTISQYTIVESFVFLFYFVILENYTNIFSAGKFIFKIGITKNYTIKQVLLRIVFKYFIFITIPLTIIYFIFFNRRMLLHDYLFKTNMYSKAEQIEKT